MYEHHFLQTNGITLHTVMDGPQDGPLVILLHGFPEFWYGWRRQIPALAEVGFRVWAPDQRGYNLSDKPGGVSSFDLEQLAGDVQGLIDVSGQERVFLVGHDWGAMVAWYLALVAPERLRHLAILNAPHPHVMRQHLLADPQQMSRSTYAAFFQLPWLPEAMLGAVNWRPLAQAIKKSSLPGAFSEADLELYREAWSKPRAMTSMLNWYRATARQLNTTWPPPRVTTPTTIIWGKKDFALRSVMAEESAALCDSAELHWLPENTHWVQHEATGQVNKILIDSFSSYL